MRNTSGKSLVGSFLLFAVGLIVFLVILLSKKKATAAETTTEPKLPRPQRNNNPFAIIQQVPSSWVGLKGTDPGQPTGFLSFDTPVNGVRAGFINLWNRYWSKGLRQINVIAPVYLGAEDVNSPEAIAWANGVSKISGLPVNVALSWNQAYTLGRAIERFENGYQWVSEDDFQKGYDLATTYTNAS